MKSGKKNYLLSDDEVRMLIIALARIITAEGGGDVKFKAKKD